MSLKVALRFLHFARKIYLEHFIFFQKQTTVPCSFRMVYFFQMNFGDEISKGLAFSCAKPKATRKFVVYQRQAFTNTCTPT